MPDQHRQFFAQLPFFLVGSADRQGRPWASILAGEPGFITSPDPKSLHVLAKPLPGDPLAPALRDGAALGGLGIELHTRRRNRVNGKARLDPDGGGFFLFVDQSFGNCAQYIQARSTTLKPSSPSSVAPARHATGFDDAMRRILASADTFFIASRHDGDPTDPRNGVDVSHRGGRPGVILDALDREANTAATDHKQWLARKKHLLILWLFKHGNRISDPPRLEWDAPLNLRARSYLFVHRQGEQRVEGKATELEVFQTLANDPDKVGHVFPWRTRSGVYKWLRPLSRRLDVRFTPHRAWHFLGTPLNAEET